MTYYIIINIVKFSFTNFLISYFLRSFVTQSLQFSDIYAMIRNILNVQHPRIDRQSDYRSLCCVSV